MGPTTRSLGDENDHHGHINHLRPSWDDPPSRVVELQVSDCVSLHVRRSELHRGAERIWKRETEVTIYELDTKNKLYIYIICHIYDIYIVYVSSFTLWERGLSHRTEKHWLFTYSCSFRCPWDGWKSMKPAISRAWFRVPSLGMPQNHQPRKTTETLGKKKLVPSFMYFLFLWRISVCPFFCWPLFFVSLDFWAHRITSVTFWWQNLGEEKAKGEVFCDQTRCHCNKMGPEPIIINGVICGPYKWLYYT